jgi:hypothetical protein
MTMPAELTQHPDRLPKRFHFEALELKTLARAAPDSAADGADAAPQDEVFDIVISTETPCSSYYGAEVLSHTRGAVDMSLAKSGLSLYIEHGGYPYRPSPDPAMHVGTVENIRVEDDRTLRGEMRFSRHELAQRVKQDVIDRTLRFISVRALGLKRKVVRTTDPNGVDTVTFTRWRPEEVSIVGIPADPNAGIARSAAPRTSPSRPSTRTTFQNPSTRRNPRCPKRSPNPRPRPSPPPRPRLPRRRSL